MFISEIIKSILKNKITRTLNKKKKKNHKFTKKNNIIILMFPIK